MFVRRQLADQRQQLVFAAGLLPPLFVVTGVSMWLIKRKSKRRADEAAPADAAAEASN